MGGHEVGSQDMWVLLPLSALGATWLSSLPPVWSSVKVRVFIPVLLTFYTKIKCNSGSRYEIKVASLSPSSSPKEL